MELVNSYISKLALVTKRMLPEGILHAETCVDIYIHIYIYMFVNAVEFLFQMCLQIHVALTKNHTFQDEKNYLLNA